jgi:hypothetical protein
MTNPSMEKFHLYSDDPDEIKIADIANAISKQVRFTGHLAHDYWYSVGEHCILVQEIVKHLGGTAEEQFAGLMHDTPEAYMSDIAAPFKKELSIYYEKEELVWKRIADKYQLPLVMPKIVKKADFLALFIEARYLVVPGKEYLLGDWVGWDEYGEEALKLPFKPWLMGPPQVRAEFLNRFVQFRRI